MSAPAPGQQVSQDSPRIPLEFCDGPNQRFYAASLLILQQSYKLFQLTECYLLQTPAERSVLLLKWAAYDIITLGLLVPWLRIPRLVWPLRTRAILLAAVLLVNWLLAGDWRWTSLLTLFGVLLPTSLKSYFQFDLAILEHRIRLRSLVDPASHILGSHTIRILPHSTAKLLSFDHTVSKGQSCQCVATVDSGIFNQARSATIPILLNNTTPKYLQYSIQSLDETEQIRYYNLSNKDLKKVALSNKIISRRRLYEDEDEEEEAEAREEYDFTSSSGTLGQRLLGYDGALNLESAIGHSPQSSYARETAHLRHIQLESTQSIWVFSVSQPGLVRIERVIDKSDNDVRIPTEASESARILVVPCPTAWFSPLPSISSNVGLSRGSIQGVCQGNDPSSALDLSVKVYGYPPLRLSYHRMLGGTGARYSQSIESIAPEGAVLLPHSKSGSGDKDHKRGLPPTAAQYALLSKSNSSLVGNGITRPATVSVPLNVTLGVAGSHLYRLDKVTDACGNSVDFGLLRERYASQSNAQSGNRERDLIPALEDTNSPAKAGHSRAALASQLASMAERKMIVYPKSQISFVGCGTGSIRYSGASSSGSGGEPVKLLQGQYAALNLKVSTAAPTSIGAGVADDAPWSVKVKFEPELAENTNNDEYQKQLATNAWEKEISLKKRSDNIMVNGPGKYSIISFKGDHCAGEILEPSECVVYTPAVPSVELSLDPITDACAGEVGLKAIFSLSGEPPYRIKYSIQHGPHGRAQTYIKTIRLSRDELELKPEQTGDFTYTFHTLEDANYKDILIDRTIKQTVHPLAGVKFSNAGKEKKVWSCEGDSITVPIELNGIAPWKVEYRLVGQKDILSAQNISNTNYDLLIKIPNKIAKSGGAFTVSFVRVTDGRGCSQTTTVEEDLIVQVHRTKPTAALAQSTKVTVKQGETVHLPLRLTGEGPWKVAYQHDSDKPRTVTIKTNNGQLLVDQHGHYELVSISDAHCPGTVSNSNKGFDIEWIDRPTASIEASSGRAARNGSIIRFPVCEGVEDTAAIAFTGHSPYKLTYDIIEYLSDGKKSVSSQDLQSVQKYAKFELFTATAGHRLYDFTGLSDAMYTTPTKEGLGPPTEGGKRNLLRLEQDVIARPTIRFVEQHRKPVYCVKDSLQQSHTYSPSLALTGLPPFQVDFEITPDGSHMSQRYSNIVIDSRSWTLSLPHIFSEPGPFTIFLRRIIDSTGCERLIPRGTEGTSATVAVADIASIAAVQPQVDHCVGESIDFILQGAAPWHIHYVFNGKQQDVQSKEAKFSRVAEYPGHFAINSVAHHQDSCKSIITNINKTIHAMPAAKVHSGSTFIENIREGDQAEIVFEFTGTPPFSFTYTKSSPITPTNRKATVLETHTIAGVDEYNYSVYTQSEGTWAVTSISDAFCSYPPLARADRKLIMAP